MEAGEKIIWDSGFVYDIGYFIETNEKFYFNNFDTKVELITGVVQGEAYRISNEILPGTEKNLNLMYAKYKREYKFPEK